MKQLLFLVLFSMGMAGCGNTNEEATSTPAPTPDEAELVAKLSGELIGNPTTQAEIERNLIINYAIDNGLDVKPLPSGVYMRVEYEGEGEYLKWNDRISVHYHGQLLNGTKFDSSYDRGQPIIFNVGQMIPGWNDALQQLKPGATATLLIPSAQAYGTDGYPNPQTGENLIPPNAVLRFDMDIQGIFR